MELICTLLPICKHRKIFPANRFPIKNRRNTFFMFNQYFDIYSLKLAFLSQYLDSFDELITFSQSFTVFARAIDRNRANIFKQFSEHLLAIFFNHRCQACFDENHIWRLFHPIWYIQRKENLLLLFLLVSKTLESNN